MPDARTSIRMEGERIGEVRTPKDVAEKIAAEVKERQKFLPKFSINDWWLETALMRLYGEK